jgi:MSHA biogenesis protein MshJ
MRLFFSDLLDRYDQLSLRERVMVLLAVLGLLALLWDSILMQPLERQRKLRQQQVEILRAEVAGLEKSVDAIVAQGVTDPDAANRAALDKLKKDIGDLDSQLAGATAGLIAPKEMARVLEQVLARTSRLTLLRLQTLPPESVIAPLAGDPGAAQAALKAGATQIYRHGVELELSGEYLEVLRFLQSLEALPWRFFWDKADYTVEQFPKGKLKLTIYTLGLQEGFVGV